MTAGVAVVLLLAHVTCMSEIAPSLSSALLQTSTSSSSLAEAHLTSRAAVSASAAASASLSASSSLAPQIAPASSMQVASGSTRIRGATSAVATSAIRATAVSPAQGAAEAATQTQTRPTISRQALSAPLQPHPSEIPQSVPALPPAMHPGAAGLLRRRYAALRSQRCLPRPRFECVLGSSSVLMSGVRVAHAC